MKPTIKDIAQRANVSTATVSRVLSKKEKSYRPETAAKIEAIAKELGYKKNLAAAELAANSSKLIAVILIILKRIFRTTSLLLSKPKPTGQATRCLFFMLEITMPACSTKQSALPLSDMLLAFY
nr:LacI family DNA-binding transcriptional regulator [Limosilactobacillus walteri]